MFNHIILSILLTVQFSSCTAPSNQSGQTVEEEPIVSEQEATITTPTTAAIPANATSTTPEKEEGKATQPVVKELVAEKITIEKKANEKLPVVQETGVSQKEEQPATKTPASEIAEPVTISTDVKVEEKTVQEVEEAPVLPTPVKPNHANWNSLLTKYVNSKGDVNYAGFKADKAKLQAYLDELSNNPPQNAWSRNEKMAFWINAYNAYTVKLIVDNYPTKSITNLKGGKPWDVKWIKIGTQTYSLNNIENDILRPKYKDARIHFAVNCAAESCPPLLNKAWTDTQLNSYFEQQAKSFINNPAYNKITANKVQISKIFDWYKEDFDNLIDYLNKYSNTKINANAKVEFLEYDWALNKQ